jgi:LacI family transcriptional regulator
MVTMKDVAEKAGVSLMTVSNVIHGKTKRVSEDTVSRIQKIIQDMNYVPNMGARNLAHQRSRLIGVVFLVPDMETRNYLQDPFISELIGALESKIHQYEFFMLVHLASNVQEIVTLAQTWNVEGLIILFTDSGQNRQLIETIHKPIVFIDCYFESSDSNFYNIGFDDFQGGLLATQHLLNMGHKNLVFVYEGPALDGVNVLRAQGFRHALDSVGISVNEENSYRLRTRFESHEHDWQQLFDKRKAFTGLFLTSDRIAIECMNYFQDRGVEVPKEVSIVGFDDILYSSMVRPRLTTIHQDVTEKGIQAIELLKALIETGSSPVKEVRLPASLVTRDSVLKR